MNLGFLCSNNRSSLLQRLLRENSCIIEIQTTILTTSKCKEIFPEDEFKNTKIERIDWKNNKEGSVELHDLLVKGNIDTVLCLFDRIIDVVNNDFSKMKLINLHPSLLPSFKGMNAVENAERAGVLIHGATLHMVTERVDKGEIIGQAVYCMTKNEEESLTRQRRHNEYSL